MTDAPERRLPGPRHGLPDEINRAMVVAEAKLLCRQLDQYLDLMGQWIEEGLNDDAE